MRTTPLSFWNNRNRSNLTWLTVWKRSQKLLIKVFLLTQSLASSTWRHQATKWEVLSSSLMRKKSQSLRSLSLIWRLSRKSLIWKSQSQMYHKTLFQISFCKFKFQILSASMMVQVSQLSTGVTTICRQTFKTMTHPYPPCLLLSNTVPKSPNWQKSTLKSHWSNRRLNKPPTPWRWGRRTPLLTALSTAILPELQMERYTRLCANTRRHSDVPEHRGWCGIVRRGRKAMQIHKKNQEQ